MRVVTGLALCLLFGRPLYAQDPERAQQAYEVLKANCFECHGEARKSGLDLRTIDSLKTGGSRGPVVVAHQPSASRLFLFASHAQKPTMPPAKERLSDEDLETLRLWIEEGASLAGVAEATGGVNNTSDLATYEERPITAEEREYWAFRPPTRVPVPAASAFARSATARPRRSSKSVVGPVRAWTRNPIDGFLFVSMKAKGIKPSARADKRTLVRRAYLDLLGLPPSPEEIAAFVDDRAPDAWPRLIDRVLASPHYGERWARHWLDLVRFADSGGFEFDTDFRVAWRYRDYVVASFNDDKPYDSFVREQLAGDEYSPQTPEAMIATGFLRLGPDSGGGERGRLERLDDVITTTSLAFMGLTVGCARCHNHKFDPIAQKDYYRMQAVFFPTRNAEYPLVPSHEVDAHRKETARIDGLLRPLRQEKTAVEAPYLKRLVDEAVRKLPEYLQTAWNTPAGKRTEGQRLNVIQIEKTLQSDTLRNKITESDIVALMPEAEKVRHRELKTKLADVDRQKPKPYPAAMVIGEGGGQPPPSYFLHRGSPDAKGSAMTPGVVSIADRAGYEFPAPPPDAKTSWRRRGLAEWLVSPGNPLTARVMVNRIWQHHFGEGIVPTPSNFGKMGERPSHPGLLDWLAVEFIEKGWSVKAMHRLMMTSEAYQMASDDDAASVAIDPGNRLFWRMPRQRLEAEIIRDRILATAGTLDPTLGGPPIFPYIDPDLFEESSKRTWPGKPDDDPSTWRRSLYVYSKRSIRYPLFETFDQPNLVNSMDRRNRSTVAPQALLLMNNAFVIRQSQAFAERLRKDVGEKIDAQVDRAFALALGRAPARDERQKSIAFVRTAPDGLAGFCHVLFNLNEFVYRQ